MKTKVKIANKDHFSQAVKTARRLGKPSLKSFHRCIKTLNAMKTNTYSQDYELVITPDFVHHSFNWAFMSSDGKCPVHGGMILHGFQETLAVELISEAYPHWSIHT